MQLTIHFDSTNPTISFAAHELKTYFEQIDTLSTIYLNNPSAHCFKVYLLLDPHLNSTLDDTYNIVRSTNTLTLTGCNTRSILLGSYKLLYLLGCRFLQPNKKYEYIPHSSLENALLPLTINKKYTASFRHRGVCIEGANSLENVLDFIDWLPKLGYNTFFIQFKLPYTFFERWYHHTLNPLLERKDLTIADVESFEIIIEEELKKRDLIYHKMGHGWTCETLDVQDLGWQKVDATLDASKKDWLALVNGQRAFWNGIPTNTNLCYANNEVKKAFVQTIVDYAKAHPNVDYLHIWLADEYNNLCECLHCQDTLLSDQYMTILNEVDKELTRLNLSTKLVFLLYQELLWPPLQETFKNHQRFTLMFAPISRTFEKSYEACMSSSTLPHYVRNQVTLPSSLEENLSFLYHWQKKWHGDSFIYDYPLGRAHYGDPGYINISKVISEDIKTLHTLHLNGYISCQELRVSFPHALPNYIMGLTLFDNGTDFDTIAQDYFAHLYGEQMTHYTQYLQTTSNLFSCDYFNGIGERLSPTHAKQYLEAVEYATTLLNSVDLKKDTYFLKKLYFHTKYVKLLALALYNLASGNSDEAQKHYFTFITFIRENELAFQESLDVYRIIEVSSKYTGFKLPIID